MRVVAGHDRDIADWAGQMLGGVTFQEPFTAFGFLRGGEIHGAAVFNDYYPGGNVEITYVGPRSYGKQQIGFMMRFAFQELKASRMTARTRRDNILVNKLLPRFGFVYEGVQRRFYGPEKGADAIVYVMWPENEKVLRYMERIIQ